MMSCSITRPSLCSARVALSRFCHVSVCAAISSAVTLTMIGDVGKNLLEVIVKQQMDNHYRQGFPKLANDQRPQPILYTLKGRGDWPPPLSGWLAELGIRSASREAHHLRSGKSSAIEITELYELLCL